MYNRVFECFEALYILWLRSRDTGGGGGQYLDVNTSRDLGEHW